MESFILTSNQFITTTWSGGTTTQLFIFPETANYQERNFQFRISTATVETKESTFTKLPGVSRKLMILEGEITITHEGKYSKNLKKFDTDEFEGDWNTSAVGKCRDFNVMTMGDFKSKLSSKIIATGEPVDYSIENSGWIFIYLTDGILEINNDTLSPGDLLIVKDEDKIHLNALEAAKLVWIEISYP